jgi:hypothetical protein
MAHHGLLPDRVIVSPARRARETWEYVSKAFPALPAVDCDDRLYEGGPDAILAVIRENDPSIRSLLIVGALSRESLGDQFGGFSGRVMTRLTSTVVAHDPVVETVVRDNVKGGGSHRSEPAFHNPNG